MTKPLAPTSAELERAGSSCAAGAAPGRCEASGGHAGEATSGLRGEVVDDQLLDAGDRRGRRAEADREHRHLGVRRVERAVAAAAEVACRRRGRRTPSPARPRRSPRPSSGCGARRSRARGRRAPRRAAPGPRRRRGARRPGRPRGTSTMPADGCRVESLGDRARCRGVDHRGAVRRGHEVVARRRGSPCARRFDCPWSEQTTTA